MSKISTLYNEYVEKEYAGNSRKNEALSIAEEWLPRKEYMELEDALAVAEDRATEDAFKAGFKAAMQLIKEALA